MRFIFIALISFLYFSSITPETYIGKWKIEGGSIIEIYRDGDHFFGKINKRAERPISNLNGLDNNNPDRTLRRRPLLGMNILNNLSFEDGELAGGTIYNADSGKTYDVKVWIDSDNTNLCYIRAYKGILFKTFEAIRIIPN
ncbi:DUF2147 domain-containing protein [Aquimarina sp. M1]